MRVMTAFALKTIALIAMLTDHLTIVFPGTFPFWFRGIGRLAWPIFAFFLAEGFRHTKAPGKFLMRLFVFAIPQGYMTVGEVAKKMKTTVRTLQYYDKEGVLAPSAESEGGRRLYTDKDIIKLHQIQSLKYLGFSLDDIKTRLVSLDTPEEVADTLTEQAAAMREQIADLSEALEAIELLKTEVLQMQSVDFKKYAAIIMNLQMKNENYGLIKYFDEDDIRQPLKTT